MTAKPEQPRYTVIIQWSDEDGCYVVSLPEWGTGCKTHGSTYEEAARHAHEVLQLLTKDETNLPIPKLFHYPGADVMDVADTQTVETGQGVAANARKTA